MAFNPFTGQFEKNQAVATLDPSVYAALTSADKSTDEDLAYLKEHVLKNKLHIKQGKLDVKALQDAVESIFASENEKSRVHDEKIQALVDQDVSVKSAVEALAARIQKLEQVKPPVLMQMGEVKINEELMNRLNALEENQKAERKSHQEYVHTLVSVNNLAVDELDNEIKELKKYMKISYALTAVGVIVFLAKLLA